MHYRRLVDAEASAPSDDYPPNGRFEHTCDFQGPFPYTASLRDANGDYRCGAVLIRDDVVLTAASCVVTQAGEPVALSEVYLGGFEREMPIERRPVVAVFPHENFTGNPVDGDDIAIVKFSGGTCMMPVPNIGRQTAAGEQYIVLGFGRTGPDQPFAAIQHFSNVTNFDIMTCNVAFGVTPPLDETQICTQGTGCKCGTICEGDAGGPLILRETVLVFDDTLMGIMSYATAPCDQEGFGVHTDVQLYLNWMDTVMQSPEFMSA